MVNSHTHTLLAFNVDIFSGGIMNSSDNKKNLIKKTSKFFEIQKIDNERLLTKQEIADFLNVSVKMIDKNVSMNEIPYLKIGRLVRFDKKRVRAWAEESNSTR